jgi:hypothetical protein
MVVQSDMLQELVDSIDRLKQEAEAAGDVGRERLAAIQPSLAEALKAACVGVDHKINQAEWDRVADKEKVRVRLGVVRDALQHVVSMNDEPDDPRSLMYRSHASNLSIRLLVSSSIVLVAVVLWGIFRYWDSATSKSASESELLRMVILMGALGGLIHWMSSLASFIGNGNFYGRWTSYYLLAPFQGSALALLVYLLLRVGVLSPANGSSSAENLNLLGLYAFSAMAGLFAKQAIEMLRDVFVVIFKKVGAKDAGSPKRPVGAETGPPSDTQTMKKITAV